MAQRRGRQPDVEGALRKLEEAYGEARFLPRFDPMEELVSCILSQHTADKLSFPTFTRLMARYEDWKTIETADFEELKEVILRAGMANQKAKAIQGSLQRIRSEFGDYTLWPLLDWPMEAARSWLQSLPGVGPKTASIVLCFAMGRQAIPVDTHVHRVSERLGWLPPKTSAEKAQGVLESITPQGRAFACHTLLIQHGRKTCHARNPLCEACVLRGACAHVRAKQSPKASSKRRPSAKSGDQ